MIVARLEHGELHKGERVRARVDGEARRPTMANHTATHLLHAALRGRLGEHVTQAGSYVGPDKLRFDFRHSAPLTPEELADVERVVNEHVVANHPLHIFVTSRDHARELGAMMLFGEKYGEHVRVVEVPEVGRELCGGTHVRSTAEIGPFVVTRETSSAQGIRRIEAVTAGAGLAHLQGEAREAAALRTRVSELEAEVKRTARIGAAGRRQRRRGRPDRRRVGGGGRPHRRGRRGRRRRRPAPRHVRPHPGQAVAGRSRAGRRLGREGAPRGELRRRRPGARPLGGRRDPSGRSHRRRRRRRPPGDGAGRRVEPARQLDEAVRAAEDAIRERLRS